MIAALLGLLEAIAGRMSLGYVQRLGALLGVVVHALLPIRRREVRRALEERLGCDAATARRIARDMYRHLGVSALEFLWMGRQSPRTLEGLVRRVGWESYEAARTRGQGVVVVAAHVGNWDLGACSQTAAGEPLHVVTKSLKARGLNAFWMARRSRMGVVLHPAAGSARVLVEALRRGESVAMIIDQRDERGIPCPFLGSDAMTSTAAATLAIRAGALLVPAFCVRDADGAHTLRIGAPIEIDGSLPVRDAIRLATRRCNEALERTVRAYPEQWLWLHRRWKPPSSRVAIAGRARYTGT